MSSTESKRGPDQKTIRMIGSSYAVKWLQERIHLYAKIDRPILLIGEPGTGKELAAKMLHQESVRCGELHTVHCASFADDPQMAESELFGYEKGSFTDAHKASKGVFERAGEGTVFLDDIHTVSGRVQAKLNRVLEYRMFSRRGAESEQKAKCRIIAATNKTEETTHGINDDLFDRFRLKINLPPLRDRRIDLIPLFLHYCDAVTEEFFPDQEPFIDFELSSIHQLLLHPWKGNVRELLGKIDEYVLNRGLQLTNPTRLAAKLKKLGLNLPSFGNLLDSRYSLESTTYFPVHWLKYRLKLHPMNWAFFFRIKRKDLVGFPRWFEKNYPLDMPDDFIEASVDFLAGHAQKDEAWQIRAQTDRGVLEALLQKGAKFWERVRRGFQDSSPSAAKTTGSEPPDGAKKHAPEFAAALTESLSDLMLRYIYEVYEDNKRNAQKAGLVLGRDRRTVGRKVKEYEAKLGRSAHADSGVS